MYKLERALLKNRFPRFGAPIPLMDGFLHDNAQGQLVEARHRIAELEEQLRAQAAVQPPQVTSTPPEELRKLEATLAKTQKAAETAETEIGRLRDELRQSSDRETNVRAQARKVVKRHKRNCRPR